MRQVGITFILSFWLTGLPARPGNADEQPGRSPKLDSPVLFNTEEADRILSRLQIFPPDNPWHQDVSRWPIHPSSRKIIATIGTDKPLRANSDMAFVLVPPDQPRVNVTLVGYPAESDRGPFPVPENLPIEGWPASYKSSPRRPNVTLDDVQRDRLHEDGDRHAIVVDPARGMLYEFYQARKTDAGWQAAQASIFDLKSNKLRPAGWTSTDAAGLPIFPAIVRYDELERGRIDHALRVTVRRSRRAYVFPARHYASRLTDENLPRMGERIRLKADYDICGFSPAARTILKALQTYGMLVADNGIEWAVSVAPDERIPSLHEELRRVRGSAFEVVEAPRGR